MELFVYDRDLNRLGMIEEITSFIWTRRYSKVGEFNLLVPFTTKHRELLQKGNLIAKRDDSEAGEIKYIDFSQDTQGKEIIEVQGKFITGWLGRRIIERQILTNIPPPAIIMQIVIENLINPTNDLRKIDRLANTDFSQISRANTEYISEPFINVGLAVEQIAKAAELGYKIVADVREQLYNFSIYDGIDRSAAQQAKPQMVFSFEFDNILEKTFIRSIERLRTTAYVGGEILRDAPRRIVEIGENFAGLDRCEVYINASDIAQSWQDESGTQITLSNAEYNALLYQRGIQELINFIETMSFNAKVDNRIRPVYKKDYDLGDIVTCKDSKWGVSVNKRIVEVTETYQDHKTPEIDIIFGEGLPDFANVIKHINQ
ncbi:MAG: siphovirus ReqiPepy6 Gp37-like family protein [Defluviitaleaceae bacterium]|nr:siphovirus ReqiPepy6 Gp37-like family protein [Defluviitaleaceae bacterium]